MNTLQTALEERIEQGLIRKQTDGKELTIYNYTEVTQFTKDWDEYTLMSRGLVLNNNGDIVARGLDKFFNLDETGKSIEELTIEHGDFILQDKLDGSLGILFWYYDKWNLATRGSFSSDQAIEGKKILDETYITGIDFAGNQPSKNLTHLFEIIYPENRIVLNYQGKRKLVYLVSRDPKTGEEHLDANLVSMFETPDVYKTIIENEPNKEGYVVLFTDKYRVKIKHEEYVRLHRVMTGLTPRRVWEALRHGDTINTLGCPEEFVKEVEADVGRLLNQFREIVFSVENTFVQTDISRPRREIAMGWMTEKKDLAPFLFARLDNKPYEDMVWKLLKPKEEEHESENERT